MRASIHARMLTDEQPDASKPAAPLDPRRRAFANALGLAIAEEVWREITDERERAATASPDEEQR